MRISGSCMADIIQTRRLTVGSGRNDEHARRAAVPSRQVAESPHKTQFLQQRKSLKTRGLSAVRKICTTPYFVTLDHHAGSRIRTRGDGLARPIGGRIVGRVPGRHREGLHAGAEGGEPPEVIAASPPCQGFIDPSCGSGTLPREREPEPDQGQQRRQEYPESERVGHEVQRSPPCFRLGAHLRPAD